MSIPPAISFDHYYLHAELTDHLQKLAAAEPQRVSLHNLYTTSEGREQWLVEVSSQVPAPADRPAYLVHANLHAPEVSGTTASLVLLHELLDPHRTGLLEETVFYIIPRLNPDGAEYALATGGSVRSKSAPRRCRNGLHARDLNGDGLILQMRWEDPCGPYKADNHDPRLLVLRKAGDQGPFYQMAQEGLIEDYDGGPIQDAVRGFDFNRNWGYNWQPEHLQWGAGDYAFSNPEMKAVADWVYAHPSLFGMLGFHNGCNAVLRPSASVADDQINSADLRTMLEIGKEGESLTGFDLRAVRDYRGSQSPPLSLKGHFTDWGYFSLGLYVFEIELGNLYNASGITSEEFFEADEHTRDVLYRRQALSFADSLPGGGFVDWQPFDHPQLGKVEIGGLPHTIWATPPACELAQIGERCAQFIIAHAGRRPRLQIEALCSDEVAPGLYRLRGRVVNTGALPTQITQHGSQMLSNGPVTVRLEVGDGVEVLSRQSVLEVPGLEAVRGHLECEWFLRVSQPGATVTIRAGSPKTGEVWEVTVLG